MASIPVHHVNTTADGHGRVNDRWWVGDDPARDIAAIVERLEQDQTDLNDARLIHARLYANQPLQSLYGLGMLRTPGATNIAGSRVTFNVCQSAVDTAAAKIAKNKPRVLFLTSGGDWNMQRRAQGLTKYTDGLFYSTGLYEIGQQVFVDACVFGTGLAKVYHEDGAVKAERVLECEVFVNEAEAINGKPRTMYQRHYIHREVAAALYGKNDEERAAILAVDGVDLMGGDSVNSPMIPAYEAWHLPSKKGGKDGRHALVIGTVTCWNKPYVRDYFPFIKMVWNPRLVGWRGQGLIDQLVGIQLEINKINRTIQAVHHLMTNRLYVEKGSKVTKSHLTNELGAIVEYVGQPPIEGVSKGAAVELYKERDTLYQKAFEITGISMLSATAQKPAGLNAAVAMREYHDIESERFVIVGQRYEQWFIEAARVMIDISRELYAKDPGLQVMAPGTKVIEEIKWSQVNMKEDSFELRAFPTSILPTTPAGRLQKIQELFEAQFIDRDTAMGLLDFPDLEGAMSLQLAGQQDAKKCVERILEDGKYETPEPYMNLQLAIKLAQSAYLKARVDGAPEKRRDLLLRFISECQELLTPSETPPMDAMGIAPPPPVDPMAAPPMPPGAPPIDVNGAPGTVPQEMTALPSLLPVLPQ